MNIFLRKNFNDTLALLLITAIIPGLWILDAVNIFELNREVLGATILAWGTIAQYYFRKAPKNGNSE
jgi:hypothetical protein